MTPCCGRICLFYKDLSNVASCGVQVKPGFDAGVRYAALSGAEGVLRVADLLQQSTVFAQARSNLG